MPTKNTRRERERERERDGKKGEKSSQQRGIICLSLLQTEERWRSRFGTNGLLVAQEIIGGEGRGYLQHLATLTREGKGGRKLVGGGGGGQNELRALKGGRTKESCGL